MFLCMVTLCFEFILVGKLMYAVAYIAKFVMKDPSFYLYDTAYIAKFVMKCFICNLQDTACICDLGLLFIVG